MIHEAQQIAIAEARGWRRGPNGHGWFLSTPSLYRGMFTGISNGPLIDGLPDYLNDLNAMHEAEKVLTDMQSIRYEARLGRIGRIFNATAAQRAEAFLRTIGKWEDEK